MTGQPVGQPVNWGSTTAPAYQEMDGNGTKGGIGLTQQQSLSATSEQLNYAAEPAQQTSGALGAINTAFGSGSGFAPADQLAPANAPVFEFRVVFGAGQCGRHDRFGLQLGGDRECRSCFRRSRGA